MNVFKRKKSRTFYIVGGIVTLLLVISFMGYSWVTNSKPTINDFVAFMEERYGIECKDSECTEFAIEVTENGHTKSISMRSHSGRTSRRSTSVEIEKNYFSVPGSNYFLKIELKGALGKYTVIKEEDNVFQYIK
ncbi:hypothetical protein DRW41_03560 [Neobacillus piezotolerans]|uniref:Uncharacterized protein n=1 Tax=Neobacillus piezotolerans TaxID=2259171 RepID=A0A3D8GWV0_9BACI|nr:hypothetical protein [Neobacillus piezotolerans]RDU38651.1 hypothetical protein DRW41_03560 [Neobacillus piezotolerans]